MKVYIRHESMAYDMLSVTHQEATTATIAHPMWKEEAMFRF
jgi:hypothetical protein